MMAIKTISFLTNPTFSHPKRNRRNTVNLQAKKGDSSGNSRTRQQPATSFPLIRFPNTILARSIVAVLGLGFVDAGYSGDWSRIGVISKETEALLKVAAFVVVPLCFLLVFYKDSKEEEV